MSRCQQVAPAAAVAAAAVGAAAPAFERGTTRRRVSWFAAVAAARVLAGGLTSAPVAPPAVGLAPRWPS